jgi:hypothetical protein
MTERGANLFKEATGMSIGWAVVVIALFMPLATGIGISILISWIWIIVLCGFAHLAHAFAARGAGAFLWRVLIGVDHLMRASACVLANRLKLCPVMATTLAG